MIIENTLHLTVKGAQKKLEFGRPTTSEELEELYRLRYRVYAKHGFITPNEKESDRDLYDENATYFVARIDGKLIGAVRLIQQTPLPTEKYFSFQKPIAIADAGPTEKCEISRIVIERYDGEGDIPRSIIMLFLVNILVSFARKRHLTVAHAFIKSKLYQKFKKLSIPFHHIAEYRQQYPENGILYSYFNQKDNPVIPIYFLASDIEGYITKVLGNKNMFSKKGETEYVLRGNLYNMFLKKVGIM